MIDISEVTIDMPTLLAELTSAGIAYNGLGTSDGQLFTYDAAGAPLALPAGAQAVVDAHVPPDPPPSDAAQFGEMFASVEVGGDATSEELAAILIGLMGLLESKGF